MSLSSIIACESSIVVATNATRLRQLTHDNKITLYAAYQCTRSSNLEPSRSLQDRISCKQRATFSTTTPAPYMQGCTPTYDHACCTRLYVTFLTCGHADFSSHTQVCQCHRSFLCTSYAASSPLRHTAVSSNSVRRPAFLFKHTSASTVPLWSRHHGLRRIGDVLAQKST